MRKNGFTLIELLAVIVILAIIALIATPIILGIINDAREKANERSVELYASAVRNSIAAYQLTNANAPEKFSDLDVQYEGEVECATEELYADGSFYIADCTVNGGEKTYNYGTKQVIKGKMSSVCNPISVATEGGYTAGDKYECDIDPNKEGYDYTFYVLTSAASGATSVNLIMDSNITSDGAAIKDGNLSDYGYVGWYEDDYSSSYGPITAMNHLQTATTGWTNVNPLTINTFTSCSNATTCTDKTMKEYVVNARMPYLSEISDYDSSANNAYLYDNLSFECTVGSDSEREDASCDVATEKFGVFEEGIEHVQGIMGYWTLSSNASDTYSESAWCLFYEGYVDSSTVPGSGNYGVRPVINLSI